MANYSYWDQILHRQFLSESSNLSNYFFQKLNKNSAHYNDASKVKHIFITGLARAGTTAVLNRIFACGDFGSILYKHMPFILSPKIASIMSKFANSGNEQQKARLHGDGIMFNSNSPECLDEVFWIKSAGDWFKSDTLSAYEPTISQLKAYSYLLYKYSQFQNKDRMIIKNNNHHLRIISLANYFKDSKILVLFRDPLSHAKSLFDQHLNFLKIHNKDSFSLEYMNLIGHREFGRNFAPFVYNTQNGKFHLNYNENKLNFWLAQWIATYTWILKVAHLKLKNIILISYEDLCNHKYLYQKIASTLDIKNFNLGIPFSSSNKKYTNLNQNEVDEDLRNISNDLYRRLNYLSFK